MEHKKGQSKSTPLDWPLFYLVRFSNALENLSGWNAVFDRPYDYGLVAWGEVGGER